MDEVGIDASALRRMLDIQEITEVIYRYCRGIDRRDYELVRRCYHADAVDDHGDFRGGVDDFLAYVAKGLPAFERTMHFIGNLLIEPEPEGDRARAESCLVAYHHLRESRTKPERDYLVGLRYIDDFERREGEWRISARVCAFEWSRIDPVAPGGWSPAAQATRGLAGPEDVVFAPSLRERLS